MQPHSPAACDKSELSTDRKRRYLAPPAFPKLRKNLNPRLTTDTASEQGGDDARQRSDADVIESTAIKEIQRENQLLKVCGEAHVIRRLQTEKKHLQESLLQAEAARLRDSWVTKTAQAVAAAETRLRRSYEEAAKKREAQHASEIATLRIALDEAEKRLEWAEAAHAQAKADAQREKQKVVRATAECEVTERAPRGIHEITRTQAARKHGVAEANGATTRSPAALTDENREGAEFEGASAEQEQLIRTPEEETRQLREELSALRVTLQEAARLTEAGKEDRKQLAAAREEIAQLRERYEAEQKRRQELEETKSLLATGGTPPHSSAARPGDHAGRAALHSNSSWRKHLHQLRKLRTAEDVALLKATLAAHRVGIAPHVLIRDRLALSQRGPADAGKESRQAQSENPAGAQVSPPSGSHSVSPSNGPSIGLGKCPRSTEPPGDK
ncbi:conserved hypothetical protein [Neospora caninum Liverpool]|uniref:Uncharacterized protein n=1 Tax=Neospora caninum (strain Liverpool) TaxID=572307 RepID=F0VAH2_NEOCL|nr:conserved hypothetical protein [Neospora caninum Liverpool]CBZ50661.1 conserved hypothetical protein [Neospora caninum Liverpool]|eukprot:XP_003880694.1 conserved hypothetical protein [Neospora caninum Liverpool]